MKTLDSVLRDAEKEAQRLLGPGVTINFYVERLRATDSIIGRGSPLSDRPLLNVRQLAELLGKSKSTVRGWCKDGTLPAKKIGRSWFVSREALERLGGRGSRRFA